MNYSTNTCISIQMSISPLITHMITWTLDSNGEIRERSIVQKNNSNRVVMNMEETNVRTRRKSFKQDLTIMLPRES